MAIAHTGKPDSPRVGDTRGSTLCLSEQVSRLLQAGSKGQEINQVESGTLRHSLRLKGIASSFSLYGRILENQILAAAVEGQPHCPVHWSSFLGPAVLH
jgi:hypothetical protein